MSFPLQKSDLKWQKDSSVENCNICKQQLVGKYFKSGKHHCRKCGRIICAGCSGYKYMNHRICYDCNLTFFNPNNIDNKQEINPYVDQKLLKIQQEYTPEKNKQFQHKHQKRIIEKKSQSKTKPSKPSKPSSPQSKSKKQRKPIKTSHRNGYNRVVPPPPPQLTPTPSPLQNNRIIPPPPPSPSPQKKLNHERDKQDENNKKEKKRRHKKHKKHSKHRKHHRSSKQKKEFEDVMDDITTEIFLKLLLSFEELQENEEKKRKQRKKRKKKKRKHRSRSKQRKISKNKKPIKVIKYDKSKSEIETQTQTQTQTQTVKIIKHENDKNKVVNKSETEKKMIIPFPIENTDEIKKNEKENNLKRLKCGESMVKDSNKWLKLSANTFCVRPKDYYKTKKKGKKVASKAAIYEIFAVDIYGMDEKLKFFDVINKYNIDVYNMINNREHKLHDYLPYLVVINVMLPLNKNKGTQLIFYSKLSVESQQILQLKPTGINSNSNSNHLPESMELFSKFIDFCTRTRTCDEEDDDQELAESFKVTIRVNNLSDSQLPFLMKQLIKRANGQSIAIKDKASYYLDESKRLFIIDIDAYKLSKPILSMWNKVNLVLDTISYDVGFHIGAHDTEDLPEQLLLCTQINKLSLYKISK